MLIWMLEDLHGDKQKASLQHWDSVSQKQVIARPKPVFCWGVINFNELEPITTIVSIAWKPAPGLCNMQIHGIKYEILRSSCCPLDRTLKMRNSSYWESLMILNWAILTLTSKAWTFTDKENITSSYFLKCTGWTQTIPSDAYIEMNDISRQINGIKDETNQWAISHPSIPTSPSKFHHRSPGCHYNGSSLVWATLLFPRSDETVILPTAL